MKDSRETFEPLNIDVDELRRRVADGLIPPGMLARASAWLGQRDQEERLRSEASQALQADAASRAAAAAERASAAAERQAAAAEEANRFARSANTRATIAIIIAVACAVISIANVGLTHWDATHIINNPSGAPK